MSENPLISDRFVDFVLYDVLDVERLCELPAFAEHSREVFDLFLGSARRLARESLYPSYAEMDANPPVLAGGRVKVHPKMRELYPQLVELGLLTASRPEAVGGAQLPLTVANLAHTYLMAGNLSATGFALLTVGAAHLIEAFGSDELKARFMTPMYEGEWTGTMALTEPQAGSSLADVTTSARPREDGSYAIKGSKIFISGGDQDFSENVVHLTLARIEGSAPGIKGISLFVVPRLRPTADGGLEDNDVATTQLLHKVGWKGLPSLALNFGEAENCRGWLVGGPGLGLKYMFQMMNEARIMVGANGFASASPAYHEALAYAKGRPQGRRLTDKDPTKPQISIIEHTDVRRLLLRQKAIVEGAGCLVARTAHFADLAEHAVDGKARNEASALLEFLTPVTKTFPAEAGFEANVLSLQVHGGYGYTTEYRPEAWMRDQKLNTIHEGTSQIQALDLLGRKVMGTGGMALRTFIGAIEASIGKAGERVPAIWGSALRSAGARLMEVTGMLGDRAMKGDVDASLRHSAAYLSAVSIMAVAWQWLDMAAAAERSLATRPGDAFALGVRQSASYWFATELPNVAVQLDLIASGEDSFAAMDPAWF